MPQGSSQRRPHRVAVIVDEGTNPFEVGVATELFGLPRPELGLERPLYDVTLCTPAPDVRMNHGFFTLTGAAGLDAVDDADTLVVPGRPDNVVPRGAAVLDAIRRTHARGARVLSFCTGSFALAEAGLLDGRRATTHWLWADSFRELHPKVLLEPDVLFVDEGDVLTAAGSAAALDLGLHLWRRDHGAEIANHVSRRLVFAAHRDGGQRQFVELSLIPGGPGGGVAGHPAPALPRPARDDPAGLADGGAGGARLPADRARRGTAGHRRSQERPRDGREPARTRAARDRTQPVGLPAAFRIACRGSAHGMRFLVRDRLLGIGDDYWIEDDRGNKVFLVDGKAMRLRDTFELKDTQGRVLVDIHQKMLALRDTMVIERDGEPLARITRKRLSLLRNHYRVSLADGSTELDVSGKILDREFAVEYDDELLAVISRRRLHVRETYGVDVVREDADPALLIAVAVCVIHLAEKERED